MYLGLYGAQGIFQARLSDSSAPVYTDTALSSIYGNIYAVYTLNYMAASAGRSLLVQYTAKTLFDDTYGIVTWQAATLFPGSAPTNSPPSVSISTPTNNATFSAPANITIIANPSDSDGTITKVEFFHGGTRLGEATAFPYSLVWSNVPAGSYTLTARATDNNVAVTTSSPVSISVTGIASLGVTLVNPVASETQFDFSFASELNRTYTVERTLSLNPVGWQSVTNVIGDGSVMTVIDSALTGAQRYYRVVSQ